jgi:hypothetical protein
MSFEGVWEAAETLWDQELGLREIVRLWSKSPIPVPSKSSHLEHPDRLRMRSMRGVCTLENHKYLSWLTEMG